MSEFQTILEPTSVQCSAALPRPQVHKCEFRLNIGLFFDGTDNNKTFHKDEETNTNIARLWHAYSDDRESGNFSYYISGVGTPFTELGKKDAETGGGPTGAGGEARIVYGLLRVANSIYRFLNNRDHFLDKHLAALCSDTKVPNSHPDYQRTLTAEQEILVELGLKQGLVGGDREEFFGKIRADLLEQVSSKLPKITAVYIDVFGFSRGAAQARVFVTWLHDHLLHGGQLFGVQACVRMLGLFDTVASVGMTDAVGAAGHGAWATADNLRIHPRVRHCTHYVALHELRTNFPSEGVAYNGTIPPNCEQLYAPGAHSDVGGGYGPGEQGKGVRMERDYRYVDSEVRNAVPDDSLKLSTLTLNQMLDAAKLACAGHSSPPWISFNSHDGVAANLHQRFGVDKLEEVREAVADYFANAGVPEGLSARDALRQHALRYLAWRYRVNQDNRFEQLDSVKRAKALAPPEPSLEYYLAGQQIFKRQVAALSYKASRMRFDPMGYEEARSSYHRHAPEIFAQMQSVQLGKGVGAFFDAWVHDSFAGFIVKFPIRAVHAVAEAQGYVRWRGLFEGSDDQINAEMQVDEEDRSFA